MSKRMLLWSATGAVYLLFTLWYTNLSGPLTTAEIDHYVALLEQEGAAPDRIAQVRGFLEADTGRQFVMVNLIDMADAPPQIPGAPPNATADDLLDIYMATCIASSSSARVIRCSSATQCSRRSTSSAWSVPRHGRAPRSCAIEADAT